MVFEIVQRLSGHWRALNGGAIVMAQVLEGCKFKNGILRCWEERRLATTQAYIHLSQNMVDDAALSSWLD